MKHALACGLGAVFVASSSAALAQGAIDLQPAGEWTLDYAEDSCRLSSAFGEGEQQVLLGLTAYEPRGIVFISALGESTRISPLARTVTLSLDTIEEVESPVLAADFDGTPGLLLTWGVSFGPLPEGARGRMRRDEPVERWSNPEIEEEVRWIGFEGLQQDFVLHTGSMRAPLAALESCAQELTTHWDIDQQAKDTLSKVARPSRRPMRWLELRDFPREMRHQMSIRFRLIVDENGEVDGCHIMGADPASDVYRIACENLSENGSFHPAEDAQGNPVRSYYIDWLNLR
nr:hypothetical protein [Aurantiacibacter sp. 219JJ12-13]MDP5260655.1 hypothetical protein [Aurantiacibacter sp. 219JJ12-13]